MISKIQKQIQKNYLNIFFVFCFLKKLSKKREALSRERKGKRGPVKKNHNGRLAILPYGPPIFEPRAIDHSFITFFFKKKNKNIKIKENES